MKKFKLIALIGILAVAFMAAPALANSVINGDFQYSSGPLGHLYGWTQDTINDVAFVVGMDPGSKFFARASTTNESSMYQIVDVSQVWNPSTQTFSANTNWIQGGISETYDFSFIYRRKSTTTAEYAIYYYTSNPTTKPTFGGLDTPGTGWTLLSTGASLAATGGNSWSAAVDVNNLLNPLKTQPRWFVVAFEGLSVGTNLVDFDNVSLTTVCTAPPFVPIPGSVVLLGTGLVGWPC